MCLILAIYLDIIALVSLYTVFNGLYLFLSIKICFYPLSSFCQNVIHCFHKGIWSIKLKKVTLNYSCPFISSQVWFQTLQDTHFSSDIIISQRSVFCFKIFSDCSQRHWVTVFASSSFSSWTDLPSLVPFKISMRKLKCCSQTVSHGNVKSFQLS